MSKTAIPVLDVGDIQATVLRPRPSPYKGEYVVLHIDDAAQGREMLRRIIPHVAPAVEWWVPSIPFAAPLALAPVTGFMKGKKNIL